MTLKYSTYTYNTDEQISTMTLKELQEEMKTCEHYIFYEEMADRGYRFTVVRELENYYNTLKAHADVRSTMC